MKYRTIIRCWSCTYHVIFSGGIKGYSADAECQYCSAKLFKMGPKKQRSVIVKVEENHSKWYMPWTWSSGWHTVDSGSIIIPPQEEEAEKPERRIIT